MCEPTTIAMAALAMSAGSSIVGYQAQSNQAKVQNAVYQQNKANSYEAMRNQYLGIQNRQAQEIEAASQAIQQRSVQSMQDQARANVASGEAGVTGFSIDRIMQDIGANVSRDISTIERNRDWTMTQLSEEAKGIAASTQSRINGVSQGTSPSPWALGFQLGGAAVNAYGLKNQLEKE